MNLHALRVFTEVANHLSVTRAAESLHLSQPAVTAQVRKLEEETQLRLIQSEGRGIRLTEAGITLHHYAKRLFSWEQEVERQLQGLREGTVGKLRVAATHMPAHFLLPQWLAAFKRTFPDVEVTVLTGNSRFVYDQLLNYQVDMSIVAGGWDEPEIACEVLGEDELWFIVPSDHPFAGQHVTLKQMTSIPFLFREEGSSTRRYLEALCIAQNCNPPIIGLQLQGMNQAIQAVLAGYGAMLVPKLAVIDHVTNQRLSRVFVNDVCIKRHISLCIRKEEQVTAVVNNFCQMIRTSGFCNK
ncbi:LysR family transcriptional regulator [Brevibacillus sp. SYSU BS000544]|uniref:LysR family transcriptional regulator n=1 Tax=Brevibacillus sp. SYSU BS000544 TaxID=3416443 RepID=UPI003CE583F7